MAIFAVVVLVGMVLAFPNPATRDLVDTALELEGALEEMPPPRGLKLISIVTSDSQEGQSQSGDSERASPTAEGPRCKPLDVEMRQNVDGWLREYHKEKSKPITLAWGSYALSALFPDSMHQPNDADIAVLTSSLPAAQRVSKARETYMGILQSRRILAEDDPNRYEHNGRIQPVTVTTDCFQLKLEFHAVTNIEEIIRHGYCMCSPGIPVATIRTLESVYRGYDRISDEWKREALAGYMQSVRSQTRREGQTEDEEDEEDLENCPAHCVHKNFSPVEQADIRLLRVKGGMFDDDSEDEPHGEPAPGERSDSDSDSD